MLPDGSLIGGPAPGIHILNPVYNPDGSITGIIDTAYNPNQPVVATDPTIFEPSIPPTVNYPFTSATYNPVLGQVATPAKTPDNTGVEFILIALAFFTAISLIKESIYKTLHHTRPLR